MANKSKQVRWITISGGVLFVGILIWSSFRQTQVTYEVCTTFNNAIPKKPFIARTTLIARFSRTAATS